jgi:hypothetical protein
MDGAPNLASDRRRLLSDQRLSKYEKWLGTADLRFQDNAEALEGSDPVDVIGFQRDFVESCQAGSDAGYVLVTDGMSNSRMNVPPDIDPTTPRRAELLWYVRKPSNQIVSTLSWLGKLPFLDNTWFHFGLRVPMPAPPITGCDFRTFLFLIPIIRRDQELATALQNEGDPVTLLTVNLISEEEYRLIRAEGLVPLLDLFDEHGYPLFFDPDRTSYV